MIKRIEVIFRRTSVYSDGSAYPTYNRQYRDGQIIWAKDYPRGYHMRDIWNTLRTQAIGMFFDIFHPAVIEQTAPPNPAYQSGENPNNVLGRQSRHIQKQVTDYPYLYQWNPSRGKWHMSESGYAKRTAQIGKGMDIGVAEAVSYGMYDDTLVDKYEKQLSGQTKSFVLFIFPNKYDDEIRSMMELRITYW
jgi:hypothetical protein